MLQTLRVANFPEKLGDRTISAPIRATYNKEMRRLYSTLKKLSPLCIEKDLLLFGPQDCYSAMTAVQATDEEVVDESSVPKYRCIAKNREIAVALTPDARNGVVRLLTLWLHPASPIHQPIMFQEEMAWPIAEAVKAVKAVEKEIGLDKNETTTIEYDDDEPKTEKKKDSVNPKELASDQ
jgi:hypothetical protein